MISFHGGGVDLDLLQVDLISHTKKFFVASKASEKK